LINWVQCEVVKKGYNGFGGSYFLYWVAKKVAYTKEKKNLEQEDKRLKKCECV
jgi:hypothetical protein